MPPNSNNFDLCKLKRFSFGDAPELADKLLDLVLAGQKTATCWSAADGQITEIGKRMIVCDGAGRARAVLETVALTKVRYCDVTEDFAAMEGEGDLSLDHWRLAHQRYFERNGGFDEQMQLWCERFKIVAVI